MGLSFHQFVDALARCSLLGFAEKHTAFEAGERSGMSSSASGRVQAFFISRMRLLDDKHVDAILRSLGEKEPFRRELRSCGLDGENRVGDKRTEICQAGRGVKTTKSVKRDGSNK